MAEQLCEHSDRKCESPPKSAHQVQQAAESDDVYEIINPNHKNGAYLTAVSGTNTAASLPSSTSNNRAVSPANARNMYLDLINDDNNINDSVNDHDNSNNWVVSTANTRNIYLDLVSGDKTADISSSNSSNNGAVSAVNDKNANGKNTAAGLTNGCSSKRVILASIAVIAASVAVMMICATVITVIVLQKSTSPETGTAIRNQKSGNISELLLTRLQELEEKVRQGEDLANLQQQQITAVTNESKQQQQQLQDIQSKMSHIEAENQRLAQQITGISNVTQHIENAQRSSNISFTAILTYGNRVASGVIPFDNVTANPGNHYDGDSYAFVCPVTGSYYFSFSLYSSPLQWGTAHVQVQASLQLDGEDIVSVFGHTGDDDHIDYKQVASGAVVLCPTGGKVTVMAGSHPGNSVDTYPGIGSSVFTGFML